MISSTKCALPMICLPYFCPLSICISVHSISRGADPSNPLYGPLRHGHLSGPSIYRSIRAITSSLTNCPSHSPSQIKTPEGQPQNEAEESPLPYMAMSDLDQYFKDLTHQENALAVLPMNDRTLTYATAGAGITPGFKRSPQPYNSTYARTI
ncbi:hypothetical protein F4803DRAFT_427133 [Xylaria telfairii]|nr:hypothetical protein F4803DRAFT_427133 [Xylaria telfairii]